MNQFIPYFLRSGGAAVPRAATSVQKCFRANDIENVGHTRPAPHDLRDARQLLVRRLLQGRVDARGALELVTEGYGIDHDRLWMTVYEDDDEAIGIWQDLGDPVRAARRGAGRPTTTGGPTPPARRGPVLGDLRRPRASLRTRGRPRGRRGPLHGDLEPRLHAASGRRARRDPRRSPAQEHRHRLERRAGRGGAARASTTSSRPTSSRRSSTRCRRSPASATAPTNGTTSRSGSSASTPAPRRSWSPTASSPRTKGAATSCAGCCGAWSRRRASWACEGEVLRPLVAVVVEGFGDAYPELVENRALRRAGPRLRGGALQRHAPPGAWRCSTRPGRRAEGGRIAGDDAFRLSDTFGFPIELTVEIAADAGLSVDEDRFRELLDEQRARARAAVKKVEIGLDAGSVPPSEFVGYGRPEAEGTVTLLLDADHALLEVGRRGPGRARLPGPHAVLRRGRRAGRRPRRDPHADRRDPRARHPVGRADLDHARRARSRRARSASARTRSPRSTGSGARPPRAPTRRPT